MANWNPPPPNDPPPPGGGYGAPPPGGFGAPPPGYGGFGPPPGFTPPPHVPPTQGSMALGFLAGFFGGCLGWALVLVFAKGSETKKGAGLGLACQFVLGFALRAMRMHH